MPRVVLPLRLAGVLLATGLPACSGDPEVVGHESTDPYFILPTVQECKPGKYAGTFESVESQDPDAGLQIRISGRMTFTLALSSSGDVLSLRDDAHLTGTTADPPGPAGNIESDLVATHPCTSGRIDTEFRNAVFTSDTGVELQFTGRTGGYYDADSRLFSGLWATEVFVPDGTEPLFKLLGTWYAYWVAPPL